MASDIAGYTCDRRLSNDVAVRETGVSIDECGGKRNLSSDAGPNTTDGACKAFVTRWGANSETTSSVLSEQPPGAAATDGACLGGAETYMKMEVEATTVTARVSNVMRTSGEMVTARCSNRDNMGNGGPSSVFRNATRGRSIASGRNTNRLRQTPHVKPEVDVATKDKAVFEEGEADVKSESDVPAPSRCVPAACSPPRKR